MEIRSLESDLLHENRETDRQKKLIVAFGNFANAPKRAKNT